MFRYFPTSYVWDLSVNLAIEMSGRMGEIAVMCTPLQDAARAPDAEGTRAFREAWVRVADRLIGLADDELARGRALRLQGLHARPDSEHWATPVYDGLAARPDVDRRIGMEGVSLGGHYAPRAVAFEPRFACGVSWGGNHDWRDVQKRRLEREGDFPVPHYWAHPCWVFGAKDIPDVMQKAEAMHLDGVLDRIRVPLVVTHGKRDTQIPVKWAQRTCDQLVNSPRREPVIFDERTGGVMHSSVDNSGPALDCISDFVAECPGGRIA